ncbi:MAG: hypothetical protein NDI66_03380 [Pseudomonas sp.]|nr:hypothetical protein [Pseudomonas sp.]
MRDIMRTSTRVAIAFALAALAVTATMGIRLQTRDHSSAVQSLQRPSAISVAPLPQAPDAKASPRDDAGSSSTMRPRYDAPRPMADLDIERLLRVPGAISLDASEQLLQGNDLASPIAALREQHGQDSDASDITDLYREWVVRSLADFSRGMWLNDLQCGLSVCIGVVTTVEPENVARAWPSHLLSTRTLPVFGYVDAIRPIGPGRLEYRFIFSTDRGSGGLRFKALPSR